MFEPIGNWLNALVCLYLVWSEGRICDKVPVFFFCECSRISKSPQPVKSLPLADDSCITKASSRSWWNARFVHEDLAAPLAKSDSGEATQSHSHTNWHILLHNPPTKQTNHTHTKHFEGNRFLNCSKLTYFAFSTVTQWEGGKCSLAAEKPHQRVKTVF